MVRLSAGASPWLVLVWGGAGAAALRDHLPFAVNNGGWLIVAAIGVATAAPFAWLALSRAGLARWSAAIALFLALVMIVAPSAWTTFETDTLLRPRWPAIVMTGLVAGLVWALTRRWPGAVTKAGASVSLMATVPLCAGAWVGSKPSSPRSTAAAGNPGPNIYQFVFDGMRSDMFDPLRDEAAFDGFTYYRDNRANYVATDASLPSMFAGRLFQGGSFRAFQAQARAGGYRTALATAGYRVSLYTPDRNRFWWLDAAHFPVTAQDLRRARHDPWGWKTLLQTALVEAAPPGLRWPMLELTRLGARWGVYNDYKQDTALFERFLADEAHRPARGQYVYFHILIPHPPYAMNADCRPAKSDYTTLAGCARAMMKRVATTLAAQGKLDDALVIFQGDHGFHADESNLPRVREAMPGAVRRKMELIDDSFGPDAILQRTRAMLLVHRPGAAGPLRTDARRSELIDIAPTVAAAAGISPAGMVGQNLAEERFAPRDWHLFAGVTTKTGWFRRRLGRDTDRGRLAHFAIGPDGRWTLHPDVIASGDETISGR